MKNLSIIYRTLLIIAHFTAIHGMESTTQQPAPVRKLIYPFKLQYAPGAHSEFIYYPQTQTAVATVTIPDNGTLSMAKTGKNEFASSFKKQETSLDTQKDTIKKQKTTSPSHLQLDDDQEPHGLDWICGEMIFSILVFEQQQKKSMEHEKLSPNTNASCDEEALETVHKDI